LIRSTESWQGKVPVAPASLGIFRCVARIDGKASAGDTAQVVANDGSFLALAAVNPDANISARVWDWHEATQINTAFFHRRLEAAIGMRRALFGRKADEAERMVHGESMVARLIVDRYADVVVFQISSAGCHRWRDAIVGSLQQITAGRALYERSDADVLELEGLEPRTGLAAANSTQPVVEIGESGIRLRIDVAKGTRPGITWTSGTTGCRSGVLLQAGRAQLFQLYGRVHAAGPGARCGARDVRSTPRQTHCIAHASTWT
jgi:23S rRNA G2069 N7-methylase RlmK/C1962 C5-methylase RlmI